MSLLLLITGMSVNKLHPVDAQFFWFYKFQLSVLIRYRLQKIKVILNLGPMFTYVGVQITNRFLSSLKVDACLTMIKFL